MLELRDICKRYVTASFTQVALDHVSVAFRDSEFVAVLGPSGSGKTTMLNVIGGLDHFDEGDLVIDGVSTREYADRDWDAYRNDRIGFVFQSYNLIPHQTVLANVELALTLSGVGRSERRRRATQALERVGLGRHLDKRPSQLSGGQMQRVAIARALINDPEILLADEPTGALDSATSVQVMDLLKEVAKDRLVIMVTHNPELARRYATRIVEVADGHVVSDSDPVPASDAAATPSRPRRKTSMGFLTALGLSFNNLMTKKGRTAMTAFAGSIGIIGIATILALSNGVNDYIARVEQDTLSSYPITITQQTYDMGAMMGGAATDDAALGDGGATGAGGAAQAGALPSGDDQVPQASTLSDMFQSVRSNDLASLKAWLDTRPAQVADNVSAIKYEYGITPLVYAADTSDGAVRLDPNSLSLAMTAGASGSVTAGVDMGGMSVFNEMLDDQALLDEQYDVVAGRWAQAPDECVLVLGPSGRVSDYTLYGMGVLDPHDLDAMVSSALGGTAASTQVGPTEADFTYDDALALSFKVLAPSDTYRRNAETGGWTDMSDDDAFMRGAVDAGLDLHVVGVVRPNQTDSAKALSAGIAYTHGLTEELVGRAASSDVVVQQLADPAVDVFTGKTFDALQDEARHGVELSDVVSVDEARLRQAFSIDPSALPGLDPAAIDLSGVRPDLSAATDAVDFDAILAGVPVPDVSGIVEDALADPPLDATQLNQVLGLAEQLCRGFVPWWAEHGSGLDPDAPDFAQRVGELVGQYLAQDDVRAILAQVDAVAGEPVRQRVEKVVSDYVGASLAPYLQGALSQAMSDVERAVGQQLAAGVRGVVDQVARQMGSSLSQLGSALRVDPTALAGAVSFDMDASDLASLMGSYANAGELTYENNLATLGYADIDSPAAVSLYPVDFEAKQAVADAIEGYNQAQADAGNEDATISYMDYMGVIMGSVTHIVHMITLVLIAFVSISLVVSSIMIGIITYISVLERKKEIGILRAIGASKRNVGNVFNAETFIEGLVAGVFAVALVAVVSVPVNAWVLETYNVSGIMSLPLGSALLLVAVSVLLTMVAGIIPSRAAARRDPVEALRSE